MLELYFAKSSIKSINVICMMEKQDEIIFKIYYHLFEQTSVCALCMCQAGGQLLDLLLF